MEKAFDVARRIESSIEENIDNDCYLPSIYSTNSRQSKKERNENNTTCLLFSCENKSVPAIIGRYKYCFQLRARVSPNFFYWKARNVSFAKDFVENI